MIAKATAISHGINALRYITGESAHKKHPEKIHHIASYWFDAAFTASSMLEAIKFKCADRPRLKNNIIRIEISPTEEYTRDFTNDDWEKLWEEFAAAFDNQEILDEKTSKVISPNTHLARSKATVWLHKDSRSGIPHLHAAVCRVDEFGYREAANWQELTNLAVALFIGMAGGPATVPSCGGGSSSTGNNWGRDKDEDNLRWARRCAKAVTRKFGRQPKSGLRR